MAANFSTNDHPDSQVYLVSSGNQALAAGSLYPASGNALGVLDGQLGLVAADDSGTVAKGTFLTAGQTVANAPRVQLVQGTPNSADITAVSSNSSVYSHQPVVKSRIIDSKNAVSVTGKAAAIGSRSAYVIGSAVAANAITAADNFDYELKITMDGRRKNKTYGVSSFDNVQPSFRGLAYTTTPSIVNPLDHIVKNLAYTTNLQSAAVDHMPNKYGGTKPFVAFAVDVDGGVAGSTTLTAIAAGTPFDFMVRNGVTLQYTPDAEFVATITNVIANSELLTTSTIQVIDLGTAGAAAGADTILLVALDDRMAVVEDREKTTKVRLRVGAGDLKLGNQQLGLVEASSADEGFGKGRLFYINYQERAEHMIWSEQVTGDPRSWLRVPSYVDPTLTYNITSIFHRDDLESTYTFNSKHPHVTHILVPATAAGVGEAATVTSLNLIVGPWLASVPNLEHTDTPAAMPAPFI